MSKFTSGPWKILNGDTIVTDYEPENERTHGIGCGNDFIADLDDGGEYHQYYFEAESEKIANAHLIAAAPELHEALKLIIEHWNKDQSYEATVLNAKDIIKKAEQALVKAEGRTPECQCIISPK